MNAASIFDVVDWILPPYSERILFAADEYGLACQVDPDIQVVKQCLRAVYACLNLPHGSLIRVWRKDWLCLRSPRGKCSHTVAPVLVQYI